VGSEPYHLIKVIKVEVPAAATGAGSRKACLFNKGQDAGMLIIDDVW